MSDHNPWKPPAAGAGDPPPPESAADASAEAVPPPSPWSQQSTESGVPADELPPPASPVAEPADLPASSDAEGVAAPFDSDSESLTNESKGSSGRRTKRVLAIATVAVVAVGLGGIFAVRGLTGESVGGAASPEELGQQFLDAVEGEDVLGIIDTLLPGERDTLGEPFVETMTELQRLEVLASDLDLSKFSGLDVQLAERTVEVEPTNVGDVVHIELAADVTVSVDGAAIPIGDLIEDNIPEDALTELRGSKTTETETLDFEMTAVQDDDRWYFSLWYTAAETARAEASEAAIPDEGVGAVGAESPEAALDRFAEQIENLDVTGLIQSLDPYEASALQRYAPLFLPDAEAAVEEFQGTIDVSEFEFRLEGDGGSRTAFVESYEIVVSDDDGTRVTASYDGECWGAVWEFPEMDPDEAQFCGDQVDLAEEMAGVEIPPEVQELVDIVTEAFSDMEPVGLELRERDGQWYLSPISTLTEAWLKVLKALDREELDEIVAAAPGAFEAMSEDLFGAVDEIAGDSIDTDDWTTDGSGDDWFGDAGSDEGASDDGTDVTFPDVSVPGDSATPETVPGAAPTETTAFRYPTDDCYDMAQTDDATTCFSDLLAAGVISDVEVPVVLRHPECGLADLTWTSELYGLGDAEFIAALTAAKPCFDDLVASGEIDEWDVPYEVENVDCFEGRNWYNVFDDEEYDARVSECTGF